MSEWRSVGAFAVESLGMSAGDAVVRRIDNE